MTGGAPDVKLNAAAFELLDKNQPIGDSLNYKRLLFVGTKQQLTTGRYPLGLVSICLIFPFYAYLFNLSATCKTTKQSHNRGLCDCSMGSQSRFAPGTTLRKKVANLRPALGT